MSEAGRDVNKVAAERRGVSVTASGKDSAATGCCAGSDAAAGDDVVGDKGVVGCCAGNGAATGIGGAGRTVVSINRGDGAGADGVVVSSAGGSVARACLGRRGSSSLRNLMTRGRNGARSHMAACRHFWMLWPGCEQNKHRPGCDREWGSGFCMVRWNGRGCGSWDGDTGISGMAAGVGVLQG